MSTPKLVIVGSVGIDTIETATDRRDEILGGSATYACAAASYFNKAGLVGVIGTDFDKQYRGALEGFGIDLAGLQVEEGETFQWHGRYEENMDNRSTLKTELGVFEHFQPDLPAAYRDAPYLFLGNIGPDLQLKVLEQMSDPKFVLLDTMDLWINIAKDALVDVISKVTMLTLNESEAQLLTGKHNLLDAADALLALGPKSVMIKKGANGSMLITSDSKFLMPAYPLKDVTDPTGAGDSFAGAFMGSLTAQDSLSEDSIRTAMLHGSTVAAFGVQSFSLEGFETLTRDEIDSRAAELKEMTRVP